MNKPYLIETFNCTDNGSFLWQFQFNGTPPRGDIPTYMVDMSRHAVGFSPAPGASVVDTVGAGAFFVPPSGCTVYGWDSRASSTPKWSWHLDNCDASLLYDEYRNLDVSDDGTTAAFSAFIPDPNGGQDATPSLHVFNAQTGAVLFDADQKVAGAGAGTVSVSKNGNYVSWSTANGLVVFSPRGQVRDIIKGGGPNELSDSGAYVVTCTENGGSLYTFNTATGKYGKNMTLSPPASPVSPTWFCVDVAMSSDGSGKEDSELVSLAWISGDVLTARITTFSMVTGKLTVDWLSATNAKLQTNPTVRMDEQYVGVALWGDSDDVPTAVVLESGSNKPVFTCALKAALPPPPPHTHTIPFLCFCGIFRPPVIFK